MLNFFKKRNTTNCPKDLKEFVFQIHITTEKLKNTEKYINICNENNVKPVLIKLEQGDFCNQPMYTKNFKALNLDIVFNEVSRLNDIFNQNGFKSIRTKIEIDAIDILDFYDINVTKWIENSYIENVRYCNTIFSKMADSYFECHIKIKYNDIETLRKISIKHNFYLSKNDIEPNIRFLSFRKNSAAFLNSNDFRTLNNFDFRKFSRDYLTERFAVKNLEEDLLKFNMEIVKEKYECCVYDSNHDLDKNRDIKIDYKGLSLKIKEELMIYISNNLPFVTKGSFLTSQYHKEPYSRLSNGGDIDLIYNNPIIKKPKISDYDSYHIFLREIETLLKLEIIDIFYKLEEIISRRFPLLDRPEFILEFEQLGYDKIFKNAVNIDLFLVNYASDGDFTTIGIEIFSNKITFEIDIAIDMPITFNPETILYETLDKKSVTLKNTTPLLYQTAWKMHQMISRPRVKDMNDIIRFLPHLDLQDKEIFHKFLNEIINECNLVDEKTCDQLLLNLKLLLSQDTLTFIDENLHDAFFGQSNYYLNLYNAMNNEQLKEKICNDFYTSLHQYIDCEKASDYIDLHKMNTISKGGFLNEL